jgi:hypothetical protein
MIWDCNGIEIQWRGRITVYYRGTFCSQWEFLNVADSVNCMSLWAAMSYWDYSALVYLTFITPWNSILHHVVITGWCAEHLFLISQIILASLHSYYQSLCNFCTWICHQVNWPHIHAWTHCAWTINWEFTKCTVPSAEPWPFSCNNDSKLCIWFRLEYRQGIVSRWSA